MKKYRVGMYGGKFMPFHKGHYYCLKTAVKECEIVHLIMFYGGVQEKKIILHNMDEYLSIKDRFNKLKSIVNKFDNVYLSLIDVSSLVKKDGMDACFSEKKECSNLRISSGTRRRCRFP